MLAVGENVAGHAYLAARIAEYAPQESDPVIVAVRGGRIIGACGYHNLRGGPDGNLSIELSCAGDGHWLTGGNLAGFLWYPFRQLKVRRLVAAAHVDNQPSWGFMERLGFQLEGVLRRAAVDGGDMKTYSMLIEEAEPHLRLERKTRWSRRNGQIIPPHTAAA